MSQVNACLKRGFIILTCFIGLVSGLTLGFTLFGHGYFHSSDDIEDMIWAIKVLYAVATATLLLAAVGVYGATRGPSWLLIIFSAGMSLTVLFVAFVVMMILIFKEESMEMMRTEHLEYWLTPLDTANGTNLSSLYELQHSLMCCGVENGYQDYIHVHETCICTGDVTQCIAVPMNGSLLANHASNPTVMVYKRSCLSTLLHLFNHLMKILIAILSTVVILWSASLLLGILILVQVRRKVDVPPVYYSAEAKAGNYACLAENGDFE